MKRNLNDVINSMDEVFNNAKKANFEDVLSKTKTYAEKATKMSAERLEISRKKIEVLDAKTKLSKAYEKFGKLQYTAYEGGDVNKDAADSCIDEITLLKSRIDYLNAEIEEAKASFSSNLDFDFMKPMKQDDEVVEVKDVDVVVEESSVE